MNWLLFAPLLIPDMSYVQGDPGSAGIAVIEVEQPVLDQHRWLSDSWPPTRIEPDQHGKDRGGPESNGGGGESSDPGEGGEPGGDDQGGGDDD